MLACFGEHGGYIVYNESSQKSWHLQNSVRKAIIRLCLIPIKYWYKKAIQEATKISVDHTAVNRDVGFMLCTDWTLALTLIRCEVSAIWCNLGDT